MSSNTPVIRVAGVSKCFNIHTRQRARLKQLFQSSKQTKATTSDENAAHEFWALRDISFEVMRGQTVGIIGQNGSGKSTLLQIITGTMMPTTGSVEIEGRVAALLELGSGFNPEFTGRENVFLNGTLLGLTRQQVEEKFDDIARFAEIGEHMELPVKTYSSGMMLRLAFAVQVAVESPVLIIDEALAVGDARFQLKCFRRLEELKAKGTTILFVSHAIEQVKSFCDLGLVLDKGRAIYWGDAKVAVVKYLATVFPEQMTRDTSTALAAPTHASITADGQHVLRVSPEHLDSHAFGVGGATLDGVELYGGQAPNLFSGGDALRMRCHISWDKSFVAQLIASEHYAPNIAVGIALADKKGSYLFGSNGYDAGMTIDAEKDGTATVELTMNLPHLAAGDYFYTIAITVGNLDHHVQLKWYDSVLHIQLLKSERNVYGVMAVDYSLQRITNP